MIFNGRSILFVALGCGLAFVPASPIHAQTDPSLQARPGSGQDQEADPLKRPRSDEEMRNAQKEVRQELKGAYKSWLDQDVTYIITDEERKAFKNLSNDEEREAFIENRPKSLLAAAGHGSGFSTQLITENFLEIPDYAQIVVQSAAAIGVKINLKVESSSAYYGKATFGNSDWLDATMSLVDYGHRSVPNVFLGAPLQTINATTGTGAWNAAHFNNSQYDKLVAQYVAAVDLSTQRSLAIRTPASTTIADGRGHEPSDFALGAAIRLPGASDRDDRHGARHGGVSGEPARPCPGRPALRAGRGDASRLRHL